MRVESRVTATPAHASPAARRPAGPAAFSLAGSTPRRAAEASIPTASLAGLDAILTLQTAADTPQERRRRMLRRGHDLLDGLDRLKVALLAGRVAAPDLRAIAERLAERADISGDPRLDGLLAEIELRAAVELAKLREPCGA